MIGIFKSFGLVLKPGVFWKSVELDGFHDGIALTGRNVNTHNS
ncbi:MAG: hypothetical protein JWN38_787 [Candidatus Saccharibacteria bacterium]|nr:hypothetical protein [Candidatus Saccharibacteria bacterium]